MVMQLRHGGAWKEPKVLRCRHSGEWRTVDQGWVRKDGVWQKWYGRTPDAAAPECAKFGPEHYTVGTDATLEFTEDLLEYHTVHTGTASHQVFSTAMAGPQGGPQKVWFEYEYTAIGIIGNNLVGIGEEFYPLEILSFPSYKLAVSAQGSINKNNSATTFNDNIPPGQSIFGAGTNAQVGDIVSMGWDIAAGTYEVWVNGTKKSAGSITFDVGATDVGWKRIFSGAVNATASCGIRLRTDPTEMLVPPPNEYSPWIQPEQVVSSPTTWLQAGVATPLWVTGADIEGVKTLEFLARFNTGKWLDYGTTKYLFTKYSPYGGGPVLVNIVSTTGEKNYLKFQVQDDTYAAYKTINLIKPFDGLWHRYTLTYDNASTMQLYVDGLLRGQRDFPCGVKLSTTKDWTVFSDSYYHTAPYTFRDAEMADIRLWDHKRSAAQVAANKDYRACVGTESGLLGLWHCDEGTGTVLDDETSLNHDMAASDAAIWESA